MRATYGGAMVVGAIGLAFSVTLSQTACRAPVSTASIATTEAIASLEGHSLFTAHCAACHGATGGGRGPAAIALSVAPRDFRHERFRYVSTLNGVPTEEDLIQSIRYGRRFGEMPANPQLTDAELRTLALYVKEIQRLGWLDVLREEFAGDEDTSPDELEEISHIRVRPRDPIHVVRPDRGFQRDLDTGRELYAANCASCHGPTGRGDNLDKPLDEQGKPISVRDLTSGEFRGGANVEEIYKRIRCGVPGTPMSAAVALTDEEVWQLVYYVRYLAGRK
ncbi:MAG: c-type cytochrome [Planctomycetes bacterium]|nr:c-type cytochrome [Planctomycetota bacterium]